jgi:hypothetical protein
MVESVPFAMLLASLDDDDPKAPERSEDNAKLREHHGVCESFALCFARILNMPRLRSNDSLPSDDGQDEFVNGLGFHPL